LSILLILLAYFFDYKSDKASFKKDLTSGIVLSVGFLISAMAFVSVFDLNLIYGIFYMGVEIILVFALKAFIQNKK